MATALSDAIQGFIEAANREAARYWDEAGYTFAKPTTYQVQYLSAKWVRIVTVSNFHDGTSRVDSAYAFIAIADGHTKTLGTIKAGDIFKPDGYRKPARHARGNVFGKYTARTCAVGGVGNLR